MKKSRRVFLVMGGLAITTLSVVWFNTGPPNIPWMSIGFVMMPMGLGLIIAGAMKKIERVLLIAGGITVMAMSVALMVEAGSDYWTGFVMEPLGLLLIIAGVIKKSRDALRMLLITGGLVVMVWSIVFIREVGASIGLAIMPFGLGLIIAGGTKKEIGRVLMIAGGVTAMALSIIFIRVAVSDLEKSIIFVMMASGLGLIIAGTRSLVAIIVRPKRRPVKKARRSE